MVGPRWMFGWGLRLSAPLVGVLAAGAASAPAAADELDGVPEVSYERYRLDNGLEVILHQDRSAPLVAVNLWYHVGSGSEAAGKSGFAHLFEHMMFQGAKHIGSDAHFETLKRVGGTGINGTTNTDRTNYFEVVPAHQLETALWLESDRMGYMLDLLDEKSLANQRDVVRNERRQRYDNVPYGQERFAIAAALYPEGHPYRYLTIGRHEDLEAASVEDVRAFFSKWYVPSNATITLAGDFELDEARRLVEKWFGSFPTLARPEIQAPATPRLEREVRVELEDDFARLERVHLVWHSPAQFAEGDLELDAAARILGASGWGRLYRRLVVEERIASSVFAYQSGSGFSGEFHVGATVKPGASRTRAEELLAEEVERLRAEPVSAAELRRVRLGTESGFVFGLESLMGRADRLQWFNHYTGDPGHARTYLEQLRALEPGGVREVAKRWLSAPHVTAITVPRKSADASAPPTGVEKGPEGK